MARIVKDVGGALIERGGKFLLAQRNLDDHYGGLWEFPGGAVEDGETKECATKREVKEELGIDVDVKDLVLVEEDEIPTLKIILYLYRCVITRGEPKPVDCKEVKWVSISEINGLDLAPIDRKIAKRLIK